jgi:twitching motility protein PilT
MPLSTIWFASHKELATKEDMNLTTLFEEAIEAKASDIHLSTGDVPCLRISGKLTRLDHPALGPEEFVTLMEPALTPDHWARMNSGISAERTINHGDRNFCLIAFRAGDSGYAATFRILGAEAPDLGKVAEGAEALWDKVVNTPRGLVIIAGPTGSGKVTIADAVVERINTTMANRIFVIEAGPAYTFRSKMSMVTKIHIGPDFESYERALEASHHADPDVIAVDDITNGEALRQIVMLAETGHLVIANMHADSVTDVLQRVFDSAGSEAIALRRALSSNLVAITTQRLFIRANGTGRVPAFEWLWATADVKNAILHGDMDRVIQLQGTEPESQLLDTSLNELIAAGKITEQDASVYR